MSTTENNQTAPIKISSSAASKVKQLLANNEKYSEGGGFLRIYVTGGGCSGFQYGFMLDDKIAEDDTSVLHQDANFVIDSLSYQYLYGSTVDYTEGLYGSKFIVTNPKAKATCGCGSSFSL